MNRLSISFLSFFLEIYCMISSTVWSAIAVHGPVTLFVFIRILLCQNQIKERDENSSSIIIAIIYIGVQKTVLLTNLTGAKKKGQGH